MEFLMKRFNLEISSSRNKIREVEALMVKANKEFGLSDGDYGKAMIAITEMVMNAIVHGNKEDESKLVKVNVEIDEKQMKIVIEDEGTGFIIADIPDPTEIQNLLESHGRGVYIAKALVDKLEYKHNERGTEFTLIINKK
jgi:anti-sigma regulatory factor (Ser/Thr protein kinase)